MVEQQSSTSSLFLAEHHRVTGLSLGYDHSESLPRDHALSNATSTAAFLLQRKRRPLDEMTQCPKILTFVTHQILNDYPLLFHDHFDDPTLVIIFSKIATQLLHRMLLSGGNGRLSAGRAKPYTAAAELLNVLTIRLSAFYNNDRNDDPSTKVSHDIVTVLCRCLSIASTVLSPVSTIASSSSSNGRPSTTNDGSLTVRDSCYGVIATLSRCSKFVLHDRGYLFGCGSESITNNNGIVFVNIDTASLLFGCTSYEDERLRPRAVAALDALLAAYQRWLTKTPSTTIERINTNDFDNVVILPDQQHSDPTNPWAVPTPSHVVQEKSAIDYTGLSNLFRNLLWSAVRRPQSTASCRVAAARWSSDLWKGIDILNACHMLCFLAGDTDSTVSSIARDGIGLSQQHGDDDEAMLVVKPSEYVTSNQFPDFGDFTNLMFPQRNSSSQYRYWDFSYAGKAATLRCTLYCLLNDFYGSDNDAAIALYLSAMLITLQEVAKASNQLIADASMGRQFSIDLLDECSACLLSTLTSSHFARRELKEAKYLSHVGFGFSDIPHMCFTTNSSRSRRYLAGAYGQLLEDSDLWSENLTKWDVETNIHSLLTMCESNIRDINKRNPTLSRLHGSAFLAAFIIRALQRRNAGQSEAAEVVACWTSRTSLLESFGRGILHDDDVVSNACSDSLSIALSYDGSGVPISNGRLDNCIVSILSNLAKALKKFGHGDTVNPARTLKLVKACGLCLAATAIDGRNMETTFGFENSRCECIDALFDLLGSMASRKTEEISIVVGEALADFADAGNIESSKLANSNESVWPIEFDEMYARELPSHEQVLFILLRRVFLAASPHKRTACAPALLAVASRGANRVSLDFSL